MRFFNFLASFCFIIGFPVAVFAQSVNSTPESNPVEKGTLIEQLDYSISKSSTYQDMKMIKISTLNQFKTNISDTLKKYDIIITELQQKLNTQTQKVDTLSSELQRAKQNFDQAKREQNSLSFLGIILEKGVYQSLTISIILILGLGLLMMFYLLKKNQSQVSETNQALEELKKEFESHRKRALEREQTMARNHLSELNKLRNK
jgi:hypothetical protein